MKKKERTEKLGNDLGRTYKPTATASCRLAYACVATHGRTVLNDRNRLQGSTDARLDERGREQSHMVGDYIRIFYEVDEFISSPLTRALETLHHAGFDDLSVKEDNRFAEIDYGDWESEPVAVRASEMISKWNTDTHFAPPNGESLASLFDRVSEACEEIMADDSRERTILVCSHATAIKAAIVWALGGDARMILKIHSHPASISMIAQTHFGRVLVGYNERPSDPPDKGHSLEKGG